MSRTHKDRRKYRKKAWSHKGANDHSKRNKRRKRSKKNESMEDRIARRILNE